MAQDFYCIKCGTSVAGGSAFCAACGTRVPNPSPDSLAAEANVALSNPIGAQQSAGMPQPRLGQPPSAYSHANVQPQRQATPPQAGAAGSASASGVWPGYDSLAWYRKSGVLSVLSVVGLFTFIAIVPVCIAVLTGPVYYKKVDKNGMPRTWGALNKVAAVAILVLWLLYAIVKAASS